MKIDISPVKNPAIAWDVVVTVEGEDGETISSVRVGISGFPEPTEIASPAVKFWKKTYTQKGMYPGDNKATVTVTSAKGETTSASNSWS